MNDPAITIRKATKDDLPLILELITDLAVYEKLEHQVSATVEKLDDTLFEKKYANVVIVHYNHNAVGFALYFFNYSTFLAKPGLYLEDLYIKEAYRNNGIGKAVFQYLCAIAVEKGCGRVEWSCLDWNEPARQFYKKIGASLMDEWTVHRLEEEAIRTAAKSI